MSSPRAQREREQAGKRIIDNCKIIWGEGDYDVNFETSGDPWGWSWYGFVRKDFGLTTGPDSFVNLGPPLTMTGLCKSDEHAGRELDRMLGLWARQYKVGSQ